MFFSLAEEDIEAYRGCQLFFLEIAVPDRPNQAMMMWMYDR